MTAPRGRAAGALVLLGCLAAGAAPVAYGAAADSLAAAVAESAAVAGPAPAPAAAGPLVVTATGLRAEQGGRLVVTLFRGPEGWLDVARAVARREVAVAVDGPDSATVTFAEVPCDSTWAVQVVHDRNGDGRLNMRTFPFPKPKEGAGVSNDHTRMGPPRYEQARFAVTASGTRLRVAMRY